MDRAGLGTNSVLVTTLLLVCFLFSFPTSYSYMDLSVWVIYFTIQATECSYIPISCCITLLALYLYYVTASPKAILLAHFFQGLISGMTIDRGCSWTPTWTPPDSPDLLAYRDTGSFLLSLRLILDDYLLSFCVSNSKISIGSIVSL